MQDAIVNGFLGNVMHVLWIVIVLAVPSVAYVVVIWFLTRRLERVALRLGIPAEQPLPHQALVELGRSAGFRLALLVTVLALGAMLLGGLALLVIGLPATSAGEREAAALRDKLQSTKPLCARYRGKGGIDLVGWRVASTADRQFVLGTDNAVHVAKFDDLGGVLQVPVPCRTVPKRKLPAKRAPLHSTS